MRVQITCNSQTWTIECKEGDLEEVDDLLNVIDDGLMKLIQARELLARLRN